MFDRWCYQGMASSAVELSGFQPRTAGFDPDLNRVLVGFLVRPVYGAELLTLDRS